MRFGVFLLSGVLACYVNAVHSQEATGPYRVGYIRDACNYLASASTSNSDPALAMAAGTCAGAISAIMRSGPAMNEQFRFCPPLAITPKQIMPLLMKFIDENPKTLDLDIRDVANYFGRLTWPCK
jgi:hypothetical protein